LHGFNEDEVGFLNEAVRPLDKAMAAGLLPPAIVAVPDGSVHGVNCLATVGTFFFNTKLGNFEDFLVRDVYDFVLANYPIRPGPEATCSARRVAGGRPPPPPPNQVPQKFRGVRRLLPAAELTLGVVPRPLPGRFRPLLRRAARGLHPRTRGRRPVLRRDHHPP